MKFTSFLPIDISNVEFFEQCGATIKKHNNGIFYLDTESANKFVEETYRKAFVGYNDIVERIASNNTKIQEQEVKIVALNNILISFENLTSEIESNIVKKQHSINEIDTSKIKQSYGNVITEIENGEYKHRQEALSILKEFKNNIGLKQKEVEILISNIVNKKCQNIGEQINDGINAYVRRETNKRLNESFEKIDLDIHALMKKTKVDLADPLIIVKYTIKQIQRFGNKPDIEVVEKLRDQIDKSINDEAGSNESLDAIKALDTYMDDNKHHSKTLASLRKLQWKIEESTKEELVNESESKGEESKESNEESVAEKIEETSEKNDYDIELD